MEVPRLAFRRSLSGSVWAARARAWLACLDEVEDEVVGVSGGGLGCLPYHEAGAGGLASGSSGGCGGSAMQRVADCGVEGKGGVPATGSSDRDIGSDVMLDAAIFRVEGEEDVGAAGSPDVREAGDQLPFEGVESDGEDDLGGGEGEVSGSGVGVRPYSFLVLPSSRPSSLEG